MALVPAATRTHAMHTHNHVDCLTPLHTRIGHACRPSVVHIACVGEHVSPGGYPALLDPRAVPRSFGSGFLWDREGHVVTNYHVGSGGPNSTSAA